MRKGEITPPRRKEAEKSPHSSIIVGPPRTLKGYSLELLGNLPWQITPQERESYQTQAVEARKLQDPRQGYVETLKVNIVSTAVKTKILPNGGIEEIIQYQTAPSLYSLFTAIDTNTPHNEARRLSHSGASMIAITGDGKIVLASRPRRTFNFPRTVESSASGGWDGQLSTSLDKSPLGFTPDSSSLLVPPTPEKAKEHILNELSQETGVPTSMFDRIQLTVMGVYEAEVKKNWDLLWLAQLPKEVTQEKLREFHREHKGNGHDYSNDPMAGHLTFIDASPQEIARFLGKMPSPAPLTVQPLLFAGYMLTMKESIAKGATEQEAAEMARRWMRNTKKDLDTNRHRINEKARRHRRRKIITEGFLTGIHSLSGHDEKAKLHSDNLKRALVRRKAYDQRFPPEEQGLTGAYEGLQKLGIVPRRRTKAD